jgi:hypothetical protein
MATITDETSFKQALAALPLAKQRQLGAKFIRRVLELAPDHRLNADLACAAASDPSEAELLDAYRSAKSIAVETYAACGHEADWHTMAAHHVACGISAIVAPESTLVPGIDVPAYSAATSARMAILSKHVAEDKEYVCAENEEQYKIADEFLKTE